jgi:hypothetical protein
MSFVPTWTIAIVAALSTAAAIAAESSRRLAAAMDTITVNDVYKHVSVLADDVYEGRAAGSRGGHAASRYLIKQIERFGFTPAGTNGRYTQPFSRDWRNVLALQPGRDPELQHELIVVGAHYDHVGYGNRSNSYGPIGRIHNGADDNASGVGVLLETMEAFALSGVRTRRPILFAFWDGEERGLVGSRHWLSNPTLPVASESVGGRRTESVVWISDPGYKIKLAVTIDMVGRLRGGRLYVLGTRSGYGMRRLMSGVPSNGEQQEARSEILHESLATRSEDLAAPLWLDFSWELDDNSDHWSFLERRVPVVLLHTGLHRDYHRPSDDVEKINREGLRDVSRYLFDLLTRVADEDRLPDFRGRVLQEHEGARRMLERPLAPASLTNWPARQPRPRLGISWREDEAEPGTVLITRVVEGTPAAAAGLAVHDRIVELEGQPFEHAAAFQSTLTGLLDRGRPELTLRTERRGHVRTVTVKLASITQQQSDTSQEPGRSGPRP